MLRGVYFTSGTQEGTPIDRLTGSLSRAFGLDQRRLPSLRPEQGKSYFLGGLLRNVIFGEAMLVSEPPKAARRRMLLRAGAFAAVALVCILAGAMMWTARSSGARDIAATQQALEAYEKTAQRHAPRPGQRRRPAAPCAAAGSGARVAVRRRPSRRRRSGFWSFGLSPDDKLAAASTTVYRHALDRRPAAATDLAARGSDARQAKPAGLPVRGHQGLPDAGWQRPGVRPRAGARLDDAGLAGHLSRPSVRRRCGRHC